MKSENKEIFLKEREAEHGQPFLGHVQNFSDKTVTGLKRAALVVYHMHAALINFTYSFQWWFIENGRSVMGYLPGRGTSAKKAAPVLSKAERCTRHRLTGNKDIKMEERSVIVSKTTGR